MHKNNFYQAFDKVWDKGLIFILKSYGVHGYLLKSTKTT